MVRTSFQKVRMILVMAIMILSDLLYTAMIPKRFLEHQVLKQSNGLEQSADTIQEKSQNQLQGYNQLN